MHKVVTKDIESLELDSVDVMRVCYLFDLDDFVSTTAVQYAKTYAQCSSRS
jgi:hypothetical protein